MKISGTKSVNCQLNWLLELRFIFLVFTCFWTKEQSLPSHFFFFFLFFSRWFCSFSSHFLSLSNQAPPSPDLRHYQLLVPFCFCFSFFSIWSIQQQQQRPETVAVVEAAAQTGQLISEACRSRSRRRIPVILDSLESSLRVL